MAVERIKEGKEREENDDKGLEYLMINSLPAGSKAILTKDGNDGVKAVIPDGVTSIGGYDFDNNHLTSVVIPSSVTTISECAFYNNQLTSVDIPDGVRTIGDDAFENNQLKSVIIPNSVISIGYAAFSWNKLTSVVIGNSVKFIGAYAFENNRLTEIIFEGEIPPVIRLNTFKYNHNLNAIYVPNNAVNIYKTTPNYTQYASIIKPISERPTKQRSKRG